MYFEPDFAAGYYQTIAFLSFIIVLAIPQQTKQVWRYFNRQKWPQLTELSTASREKVGRFTVNYDFTQTGRMSVIVLPETKPIHSSLVVMIHKFWNDVIHVIGVGDMGVGEIVLFLIYVAINLVFIYTPFTEGQSINKAFGNRCAYIALANAAFVFPLATRNSIFLTLLGVSFEHVIKFHRWVGRMIFVMISFHGAYQVQLKQTITNSVSETLFGETNYLTGFWAWFSLAIIMITSHSIVRRYAFELFYWAHFAFIPFLVFGALHTNWFLPFVGFGSALYFVDRSIRAFLSFKPRKVIAIDSMQSSVTRIIFESNMFYEAGQYVFVNFPDLHRPLSMIQWHPLSLSSAPSVADSGPHYATLHMKAQGGFSKSLYDNSSQFPERIMRLKIDGPYGRSTLDFSEFRTVMLVGGGIGITPMISILSDLLDRQVVGLPLMTQSIYFIWVIPNLDAYGWFASELQEIMRRASALPQNKYLLEVKVFLTKSQTTPSSIFFEGRPNFAFLMNNMKKFHGSGDVAVGACGPSVMVKQVQEAAVAESDTTGLIKVHTEVFAL